MLARIIAHNLKDSSSEVCLLSHHIKFGENFATRQESQCKQVMGARVVRLYLNGVNTINTPLFSYTLLTTPLALLLVYPLYHYTRQSHWLFIICWLVCDTTNLNAVWIFYQFQLRLFYVSVITPFFFLSTKGVWRWGPWWPIYVKLSRCMKNNNKK